MLKSQGASKDQTYNIRKLESDKILGLMIAYKTREIPYEREKGKYYGELHFEVGTMWKKSCKIPILDRMLLRRD